GTLKRNSTRVAGYLERHPGEALDVGMGVPPEVERVGTLDRRGGGGGDERKMYGAQGDKYLEGYDAGEYELRDWRGQGVQMGFVGFDQRRYDEQPVPSAPSPRQFSHHQYHHYEDREYEQYSPAPAYRGDGRYDGGKYGHERQGSAHGDGRGYEGRGYDDADVDDERSEVRTQGSREALNRYGGRY
ncbi:hypothetical protein HK097_004512, partial [Rhizophlyctis rosea]